MKNENCLFVYLLEQKVKEHYQDATDVGPIIDIHHQISSIIFDIIDVKYRNTTDEWKIDFNKQCKVCKNTFTFTDRT